MTDAVPSLWDSGDVAEAIDAYWRTSGFEQAHRETLADLVRKCVPPVHRPMILEVGCGSGLVYERLAEPSLRYIGVDSAASMLALARRAHPRGVFVGADGYRLPFADRSVDVTLCFEVLGHLAAVRPFVAELLRVTRHTVLFTVWPSTGDDITEGHETVEGVTFLHRAYSDAYVRRSIAQADPSPPSLVERQALSTGGWAYAVHLTACAPAGGESMSGA
jgi:ubiquinone/menaquinone biosynthesis C-methylase UbiE